MNFVQKYLSNMKQTLILNSKNPYFVILSVNSVLALKVSKSHTYFWALQAKQNEY